MRSISVSWVALLLIVGCSETKQPSVAVSNATTGSGRVPDSGDPGCPPLPALENGEEMSRYLDLNGDGVKDVVISPGLGDCGSEECLHSLYVVRGKCFDPVGTVFHIPELLETKHHGLFDVRITVRIDGKSEHGTYRFDGKKYVTE